MAAETSTAHSTFPQDTEHVETENFPVNGEGISNELVNGSSAENTKETDSNSSVPETHSKDNKPPDTSEGSDDDNMPDLIWTNTEQEKVTTEKPLPYSASNDTGFASDSVGETPSPENEVKSVSQSLEVGDASKGKEEVETETSEDQETVMDILGNGLLVKTILVKGQGISTRPSNGDTVTLRVEGKLEDGTEVDSGDYTFTLNDGDVIVAFDLACSLMEAGEKCQLKTDARYAYGSKGRDPDIPKDASITYNLEILESKPAPELSSLSKDQRLKLGEEKRERGNYLFGRGDYTGAINSYTKATKILDDAEVNSSLDEASRAVLADSWVKCYNNMAACQLKIDAYDAAIKSCEKVLSIQEKNVKALFRIGKAYGSKNEVDIALTYVRSAIKLDPESKMLHQEMHNLTRRKSKETAVEKELYQRMLGVKPGEESANVNKKEKPSNMLMKWALVAGTAAAVLVSVGLSWYRTS